MPGRPGRCGQTPACSSGTDDLDVYKRQALSTVAPDHAGSFPTTILAINLVGALALGWLSRFLVLTGPDEGWRRRVRLGVGTGVIGGFTTYSTFIVQTLSLMQLGRVWMALGYLFASLLGGIACVWLGIVVADRMARTAGETVRP